MGYGKKEKRHKLLFLTHLNLMSAILLHADPSWKV